RRARRCFREPGVSNCDLTGPAPDLDLDYSYSWSVRVYLVRVGAVTAAPAPASAATELRAAGLRVTAARVALLEAVRDRDHLGVPARAIGAGAQMRHTSRRAVIDAPVAPTAAGLNRRTEPAGSPARFEGRIGDNHHHLVCRSCGTVTDVACAVGEAPCLTAADDHGFSIDEAEVIYWGLCPSCSTRP